MGGEALAGAKHPTGSYAYTETQHAAQILIKSLSY